MSVLRQYDNSSSHVREHYKQMRSNQTLDYVLRMKKKYSKHDMTRMTMWKAFDMLDDFIDTSDPDLDLPNNFHLVQTAEAIRAAGCPDSLIFTGFIHDIGKVIAFFGEESDGQSLTSQWGIAGDTFVVGAKIPDTVVYPEFNILNTDMFHPVYSTDYGGYCQNCGLDNLLLSYGHDEYLYDMLRYNKIELPDSCYKMIRYHSFYSWHTGNSYEHFMDVNDYKIKQSVLEFNKYDLYTKIDVAPDIDELQPFYENLIDKFAPGVLKW